MLLKAGGNQSKEPPMSHSVCKTMAVIALSAMTIAPIAGGSILLSAEAAFAKGGKDNGNGNGGDNGKGNDRGGNSDRGNGNDRSSASGADGLTPGQARKAARQQIIETAGVRNWGAIASELGELNKANANVNARLNSSDPVHQALAAYELSGGITLAGVREVNEARESYATYREELLGTEVEDPPGSGTMVEITPDNLDQYAESFEDFADLSEDLAEAYAALATLSSMRDKPLTRGALDALNGMLGLEDPVSQ